MSNINYGLERYPNVKIMFHRNGASLLGHTIDLLAIKDELFQNGVIYRSSLQITDIEEIALLHLIAKNLDFSHD